MTGVPGAPTLIAGRRSALVAAGAAGLAAIADLAFDPAHRDVPLCPFHAATGWWCPLCGSLRAVDALGHLQWRTALHANALLVVVLPLLFLWWGDWLRTGRARRIPVGVLPVVLVAVLFTVVRNLPAGAALRLD